MQCRKFREIADSYLGDELMTETNHEMIEHLETCADCRRELAARRELHVALRRACDRAPELQLRPEFAALLQQRLEAATNPRANVVFGSFVRHPVWAATMTACLIIAIAFGITFKRQQRGAGGASMQIADTNRGDSEPPNARTVVQMVRLELAQLAAGDHRDCAVDFRLAEEPVDLAESGRRFDPVYTNLADAVMSYDAVLNDIHFIEAHSCVYEGRRFGHVVLRHKGQLVSVLVTAVDSPDAETSDASELQTALNDQAIACSEFGDYQLSCFETASHAVFVVSSLTETENLTLARALAPSVRQHITRRESVT